MKLSHHIKWLILSDLGMTLVPRRIINNDSDTEYKNDVESDSEVNVGEEVNVSEVSPVSGELSTGAVVTTGWKSF